MSIHDEEKGAFLVCLRQGRFIGLQMDGATDSGNLEDEIIYVKFVDAKRGPVQRFIGIQDSAILMQMLGSKNGRKMFIFDCFITNSFCD